MMNEIQRKVAFFSACMILFNFGLRGASAQDGREEYTRIMSAREYFLAGQYDMAEQECRKALEVNPNSLYAYKMLGSIYADRPGREEEALGYFGRVLEIEEDLPVIYGEMSSIYTRINMQDKAAEILRKGVERFPEDPALNYAIGLFELIENNDPAAAITHFKVALDSRPDEPGLLYITGFSEVIRRNDAEVFEYITRLREGKNETMAVKLEEAIRHRDGGVDMGDSMETYFTESTEPPEGQGEDVQESKLDAQVTGPVTTSVQGTSPTATIRGSGTLTIKQTYEPAER